MMPDYEDVPAAKLVAIGEIASIRSSRTLTALVNRVISTILIIVVVIIGRAYPAGEEGVRAAHQSLLYVEILLGAGLLIQITWIVSEYFLVRNLRRAMYRLALIDSHRYSSEWEDKFVGLRTGARTILDLYLAMIEPTLWAMLFVFSFSAFAAGMPVGLGK